MNSGNFQTILALLRAGSDVNGKDQEGDMGLHKSAKIGNDEIVGLKILWASNSELGYFAVHSSKNRMNKKSRQTQ